MPWAAYSLAGTYSAGYSGDSGPSWEATLNGPRSVAVDSFGNIYVADMSNYRVRKISAATGIITTVAGNGTSGTLTAPCTAKYGNGCPATQAYLLSPRGVAVDASGNLYISDEGKSMVRRVDALTGIITTVAGTGSSGGTCAAKGPANLAQLRNPESLMLDKSGNLYIADSKNNCIRKVDTSGNISTVAGTGAASYTGDLGPATQATLNLPKDMAMDPSGNLAIADTGNYVIRLVDATTGTISTVAHISYPDGVAFDKAGHLYVADSGYGQVYSLSALSGDVYFNLLGQYFFDGPYKPAFDARGNVYVPDYSGNVVMGFDGETDDPYRIQLLFGPGDQMVSQQIAAGNYDFSLYNTSCGVPSDSTSGCYTYVESNWPDSRPGMANAGLVLTSSKGTVSRLALTTMISAPQAVVDPGIVSVSSSTGMPQGMAVDRAGDLFVTNSANNLLTENSAVIATELNEPRGVALDAADYIYIADTGAGMIRKLDPSTGTISQFAGGFAPCSAKLDALGDGCPAIQAMLSNPSGVAADTNGNIYIADTGNDVIRRVDALTGQIVKAVGGASAGCTPGGDSTVAYTATDGYGDGCAPLQARLNAPTGVAVDGAGNLYIADTGNNLVRKVDVSAGIITNAGGSAGLNHPTNISVDAAGDIYFVDSGNHVLRMISATTGTVTTVMGQLGVAGSSGTNGASASGFTMNSPFGVVVDDLGNLYVSDAGNSRVLTINRSQANLQFGPVTVGTWAAPQTLTISNTGNIDLALNWPPQTGAGVSGSCSSAAISPGASCSVSLSVLAGSTGPLNQTLTISGNANSVGAQLGAAGVLPTPNIALACTAAVYDNTPHRCAATATGIGRVEVRGTFSFTYTPGGSTPPVAAGTYAVNAGFISDDPNYGNASSTSSITINPVSPVINVSGGSFLYDGRPHAATAVAKGIGGATVSGTFEYSYAPGGTIAPTAVGSYTVLASFTSGDTNYSSGAGNGSITIIGAPVAQSQNLSANMNGSGVPVTLSATNSPTSWSYGQASNGVVSGTAPNVTYTPKVGFVGTDSFTFTATNAGGPSAPATVTINVTMPAGLVTISKIALTFPATTVSMGSSSQIVTVFNSSSATIAVTPLMFGRLLDLGERCVEAWLRDTVQRFRALRPDRGRRSPRKFEHQLLRRDGCFHGYPGRNRRGADGLGKTSLTFSSTHVNAGSSSQTVSILNRTGAPVTVTPALREPDFIVSANNCPASIGGQQRLHHLDTLHAQVDRRVGWHADHQANAARCNGKSVRYGVAVRSRSIKTALVFAPLAAGLGQFIADGQHPEPERIGDHGNAQHVGPGLHRLGQQLPGVLAEQVRLHDLGTLHAQDGRRVERHAHD